MIQEHRRPAVVAPRVGGACLLHDGVAAAHGFDVAPCRSLGRQGVQVGGVAVEPAEVVLVDRLGVVIHGSVVAAVREGPRKALGQLDLLGHLEHGVAVVRQAQRLVVDVLVDVALLLQILDDPLSAPGGPVVAGEEHFRIAEEGDGLVDVGAPAQGIAHLCAAQRIDVVQHV